MSRSDHNEEHISRVINAASATPLGQQINKEDYITDSWKRCIEEYKLNPGVAAPAHILPAHEILEHKDQIDSFLHVARIGMEGLYKHVASLNYVLLLTDATGITVDYIGNTCFDSELKDSGLYLGADWSEERSGTNGAALCIRTQRPVICHRTDHFHVRDIQVTCSAAPVCDPTGELLAVLDISALHSPAAKEGQILASQLVSMYARKIESANFVRHFSNEWIIRFTNTSEFVDVSTENLIALGSDGNILGATQAAAKHMKSGCTVKSLIGKPVTDYFECTLDELMDIARNGENSSKKMLITRDKHELFFAGLIEPKGSQMKSVSVEKEQHNFQPLERLSHNDALMDRAINRAKRLVDKNVNIVIGGETGTGKEVMARALHDSSARAGNAFIAVNCAAIPEALIESELFGYKAGSFTGANTKGQKGLIMQSSGGTLFLDEIGDMPLQLQSRLLRVLAEKEVMAVGANKPEKVDLHVISASHRDLRVLISEGTFREDLYYRLNGAILNLPALRDRTDKGFITMNLVAQEAKKLNVSAKLSNEAMKVILGYSWPGNVRQLRNAIQFALAICEDNTIGPDDLPDELFEDASQNHNVEGQAPEQLQTSDISQIYAEQYPAKVRKLVETLKLHQWNITAASEELGISRSTIYRHMERYGIVPPNLM
ncbi:Acetoin catabolism regulatory protein [Paraglaciecola mesophila]|uniref:Acetoin catabolism regulatory protein n=1 Tax=Paraglaciecola mesophila TaxID=197222 RepID=A0A857JIR4_9ALTE|nr:sigma-54-dependent Fis family transcriptional regulator [Paraglaciecola mesophila]QHJ11939.1 Acetoin catabolism regulatory protein [Paraglaciecola mesophila]